MKKYIALAAVAVAAGGMLLAAPGADAAPAAGPVASGVAAQNAPRAAAAPGAGPVVPATAYNGACGSGYVQKDSMALSNLGVVYLTYNSSNGYNCVVTVRANPGTKLYMEAGVQLYGSDTYKNDFGLYTTYAGPVYVHAPGQCINWWGHIDTEFKEKDKDHCG